MCWISTRKDGKAIAKVAKKDIPIIKIGHRVFNKFVSAKYAYEYNMGELQKHIKIEPIDGTRYFENYYIEEGYHFYKPEMIYLKMHKSYLSMLMVSSRLSAFFHCRHLITETSCVVKGYIPRGTIYYLNANGEGVAEQIVLTEMISINDYLTNKKLSKL